MEKGYREKLTIKIGKKPISKVLIVKQKNWDKNTLSSTIRNSTAMIIGHPNIFREMSLKTRRIQFLHELGHLKHPTPLGDKEPFWKTHFLLENFCTIYGFVKYKKFFESTASLTYLDLVKFLFANLNYTLRY
jgi:hypothetical protein